MIPSRGGDSLSQGPLPNTWTSAADVAVVIAVATPDTYSPTDATATEAVPAPAGGRSLDQALCIRLKWVQR